MWILGGRAVGLGNFADVERYRPGASGWDRLPPMPVARSGFQAVNVGGKIVVVGGEGPAGTIARGRRAGPGDGPLDPAARPSDARHGLGLVADGPLVYAIEGGPQPGLTTSSVVERLRLALSRGAPDSGSPAVGALMKVLRRRAAGEWVS